MFQAGDVIVLSETPVGEDWLFVTIEKVLAAIPPYGYIIKTREGGHAVVSQQSELMVQTTFITDLRSADALQWYSRAICIDPQIRSWSPAKQAAAYSLYCRMQKQHGTAFTESLLL